MLPMNQRPWCVTVALAVAQAIAHGTAVGQQRDDELETVTIVARVPRALAATEANVAALRADRIEERLAVDLRDLARYEPSLSVRGDATRFGDDSISIRGIGGNRIRIETDGVPRPSAFAVGNFANAGRALSELDFVRQIEILRGPASATYGSSAIGGVIASNTLDPVDLVRDDARIAARVRMLYASDDHGLTVSGIAAGRSDRIEWLAGARRRDAGELQNSWTVLDANPRAARDSSWIGKLVFPSLGAPLRITTSGTERRARTDVDSLLLQPGRFANTIFMRGDDRSTELSFAVDQRWLDLGPLVQLEWRLFHEATEVLQLTAEERRAAPPRSPAVRLQRSFAYEASVTGGKLTGAVDANTAAWTHRISFGFDLSQQDVSELRDGLQTTLPSLATTRTILGEAFPLRDFPDSRIVEAGAFVFDEIRYRDSRWSVSPALRFDHYRLTPRVDALYREDNPTQTPVGVSEQSLSPRLGVAWQLAPGHTAFGQYTYGFRAPPFEDVNIGLDIPLFQTRAIPNPQLEPESSQHFELGLRSGTARLAGTASIYLAQYRNFIESKVNLGRDPASGYTLFQSQNRARARIAGVELAARVAIGSEAALDAAHWVAHVSASWSRGEDQRTNLPLNSIDPARATLGLQYRGAAGRLQLEGVLNVVAAQDRVDESSGPLARAGGHATLDLLAGWKLTDAVHLRAALFNALDRRHVEWADVRGLAASDPSLDLYTRPGRSVTVGVTLQLD